MVQERANQQRKWADCDHEIQKEMLSAQGVASYWNIQPRVEFCQHNGIYINTDIDVASNLG